MKIIEVPEATFEISDTIWEERYSHESHEEAKKDLNYLGFCINGAFRRFNKNYSTKVLFSHGSAEEESYQYNDNKWDLVENWINKQEKELYLAILVCNWIKKGDHVGIELNVGRHIMYPRGIQKPGESLQQFEHSEYLCHLFNIHSPEERVFPHECDLEYLKNK